jgi:hypothetical protein
LVTDVTGQLAVSLFKGQAVQPFSSDGLTRVDGTDMLPRNVGNQQPTNAILISQTNDGLNYIAEGKPDISH